MFWKEVGQEKTEEEILREQYDQSKMGYLEEKLKTAKFETLPHIVIGCPSKGILFLNVEGATINVPVRSSEPFTIEEYNP